MKRCSNSLVIEGMQIETEDTISYSDWQKTEKSDNVECCEECETTGGSMNKYHPGELIGSI